MRETIETILTSYDELTQERKQLTEMIRRLQSITQGDAIDVLSFSRNLPHDVSSPPNITSRPEAFITGFQDTFWRKYQEEMHACLDAYYAVDVKIRLLESAVAALPEHYARLINALYFQHLTWDAIENELNISRRSISNHRKKALLLLESIWARYASFPMFDRELSLSPFDSSTYICPDCGTRRALDSIGISPEEQEKILSILHQRSSR